VIRGWDFKRVTASNTSKVIEMVFESYHPGMLVVAFESWVQRRSAVRVAIGFEDWWKALVWRCSGSCKGHLERSSGSSWAVLELSL
jgi:hypothetical protein